MEETATAELDPELPPDHSRERRLALVLISIIFPLSAFLVLIPNLALQHGLVLAMMIVINALALTWMQFGSIEQGRPVGTGTRIAAMLVGALVVPVHLLRTHGWGPGSLAAMKAVGFYALLFLLYAIIGGILMVAIGRV